MSCVYRRLIRPVLFLQDSEAIHNRTLRALGVVSRSSAACTMARTIYGAPSLPIDVFGLAFPNPVGLAAGMDKQAEAVPAWAALGFGFSELGGVTAHAQPGNPMPRMFRAIPDLALVNRMGFNNGGAEALSCRLAHWHYCSRWPAHPVGINLGKSKITANEEAARDYAASFRLLKDLADFFVVNVSSPNTPNLRQLQDKTALEDILAALQELNREPAKPILVKVAPDLSFEALDEILDLACRRNLSGIVATNTTITRPATSSESLRRTYNETGGLSGRPLRERSTEVIRHIYRQSQGTLPIIGVGGIFNADDAWEKITAGSSLIQVYTGLVYEGPAIVKNIVRGLKRKLAEHGLQELKDAVGLDVP
jgi:dihydroorotate dehydrogenase